LSHSASPSSFSLKIKKRTQTTSQWKHDTQSPASKPLLTSFSWDIIISLTQFLLENTFNFHGATWTTLNSSSLFGSIYYSSQTPDM
jgi:hypothetical protein